MNTIQQLITNRNSRLHFLSIPFMLSDWLTNNSENTDEAEWDNLETDKECVNHFNGVKHCIETELPF